MPDAAPKPLPELTEEEIDALLLEGINSGSAEPVTRDDWAYIRAKVEEHISRRQQIQER